MKYNIKIIFEELPPLRKLLMQRPTYEIQISPPKRKKK